MDILSKVSTYLIIIAFAALLAIGIYFIVTEFVISPSSKAGKAVLSINKKKLSAANQLVMPIANKIVKFIHLSEERHAILEKKLYAAEIDYTPEFYTARAIALSIVVAAFGLLFGIITPLITVVFLLIAVAGYIGSMQEADKIIRDKSEKIQGELVLFASTIQTQLATSHDLIKIFESYRKICGEDMRHELDITLADMKTGSYEEALKRLETRIQSQSLSEIIRGLQAVLRGDDQRNYFDMLVHDLVVRERERLRRKAAERPAKMKVFSFLTLGSIMLIFFYVIGYQIVDKLQGMF